MTRSKIDWEKVYNDFRTGRHSNRALGTMYNVSEAAIRKKAKKEKWTKDLVQSYQSEIQNTLIEEDAKDKEKQESTQREPDESTQEEPLKSDKDREDDRDLVKDAAKIGASVIREHRKDIKRLTGITKKILSIVEKVLNLDDYEDDEKKKIEEKLSSISTAHESITDIVSKLSRVNSERIKLERQAYNMDSKEAETSNQDLDSRIKSRMNKLKNGSN